MHELPDQLEGDSLIITKHGKPVMAAMSFEQFENLMETLEILSDSSFAEKLRASLAQADQGESVSLDEVEARLR
jgi:antitoxin YefM